VAITGQVSRDRMHKESHQHVNIVEAFGPFTKWNARVETGAVIPEVVRKAFKLAQEEKPGACHIELPEDVAEGRRRGNRSPSNGPGAPRPISHRWPGPQHSSTRPSARSSWRATVSSAAARPLSSVFSPSGRGSRW
jgi:thiamine pyrophosphate-dependent acetolactate synthase large subunit-like protein